MATPAEQELPTYTDSPRIAQGSSATGPADGKSAGIASALARFEYEAEKTSVADATKVLLIEWEEERDSPVARDKKSGQWSVQWKSKNNKVEGISLNSTAPQTSDEQPSARGRTNSVSDPASHRLYFLLTPGAPVPSSVSISFSPASSSTPTIATSIPTLPAIFPPSLLTSGTSLGKKGVLHTLWAKSRLAALRSEIDEEEAQGRLEGVGISMAEDELEWIKEHFGVSEKHHGSVSSDRAEPHSASGTDVTEQYARGRDTQPKTSPAQLSPPLASAGSLPSPTSATSPSDRLQQKMKGLRVGTSPASTTSPTPPGSASSTTAKYPPQSHTPAVPAGVFTPPQTNSSNNAEKNPLSPEVGDVAVGSRSLFAALKGPHPSEQATKEVPQSHPTKKPVAVVPPTSNTSAGPAFPGMGSLDGIASVFDARQANSSQQIEDEPEEGLFALPMSPRSPEMAKSPFSVDAKEVVRASGQ